MGFKYALLSLLMLGCSLATLQAQSPAALEKLQLKYDAAQIADIQQNTHYKYEGLLLYYSSSFLVVDNGQPRAATEDEIRLVNLDQYNAVREAKTSVTVHDAALGHDIVLLGRTAFEAIVVAALSEADLQAYQAYKAAAQGLNAKDNQ
jgi:hypothetical protein